MEESKMEWFNKNFYAKGFQVEKQNNTLPHHEHVRKKAKIQARAAPEKKQSKQDIFLVLSFLVSQYGITESKNPNGYKPFSASVQSLETRVNNNNFTRLV